MARCSQNDVVLAQHAGPRESLAVTVRSLALAAGLTLAGVGGAVAQESTPEAGAGMAECVAPDMAAPADAMASPAAEMAGSPAAEEAAAEGAPADEALSAEAVAALENYTACFNAGEIDAVLALTTPEYLMKAFGTDDLNAIAGALAMSPLPQTEIISIGNVMTYDDGRVSVDSEYFSGEHQYSRTRTFLVQSGDAFLVADEEYLPAQPDVEQTSIIAFTIADDTTPLAFDQSTAIPAMEGLILYGANNGAEMHSVALFRLPDEAVGTPVAEIPVEQMVGGEFIGAVNIEAGGRTEFVLVNLPAGTYVLIDPLVPGSAATLTINEPAAES